MRIGGLGTSAIDAYSPALRGGGKAAAGQDSPESQSEVQRLKQVDQKVRAHEQAHLSAAAGLSTGGASFQYVRGPDGRQYAVGGEVSIDVSAAATPEQTIAKAQRIRAAALAPADPSSQDRAVAAAASQLEAQARAEASRKKQDGEGDAASKQGDKAVRAYGAEPASVALPVVNTYA